MSYRQVLSQGSIPFSWEDRPGVSKFKCPVDIHVSTLEKMTFPLALPPPPPCRWDRYFPKAAPAATTLRSISGKGLRWQQEDPFLAAFKECTKSGSISASSSRRGFDFGAWKNLSIFSCKRSISCDAMEDNYVRLPHLLPPPPPSRKDRIRMIR